MDCPNCRTAGICICPDPAPATTTPPATPPDLYPLTFPALRRANAARLPLFKNARGAPAHSEPDGSDWSLSDWATATLGELGEAANLVKKVRRGDLSLAEARDDLAAELADTATYLDIFAARCGVDLGLAVAEKFGRISRRVGAPVSLELTARDRFLGLILAERERQVAEEGHTPADDDRFAGNGELADCAAAYCLAAGGQVAEARAFWPYQLASFKPHGARRDLVRAAALILAELERLERHEPSLPLALPAQAAPAGAAPEAGR